MEWKAIQSPPVHSTGRTILEKVIESSRRYNLHSLDRQIGVCQSLFSQEKIIDGAILGQFKAGKSSFINSLIEKDILPVGVTPVTTVVRSTIQELHESFEPWSKNISERLLHQPTSSFPVLQRRRQEFHSPSGRLS